MELLFFPIVLLFVLGGFLLNLFTSIWCYRDSLNQGNSKEYSLLILVATLFFPVLGFIIYLIIRR
ncbi:PLDc N-terminal domain-containing protein [Alkalihalobacillus oceani]|uniref:PLDc N-terminal domain-containing protein n=1 Tax=Halalkalibacter oceani TaxID=1653776 RepID=A0A9X2IPW1_9BACI|nr:PLDc N-terminal domain-containing protein [Halalkalibacter oceani]MCM3716434.1 PLDc N-terminal domain-containing protein [Halalkalibacter oceani]MCM3760962.1 PLDc N-terminal domain-containing protein [Halalkalibacter oceani]